MFLGPVGVACGLGLAHLLVFLLLAPIAAGQERPPASAEGAPPPASTTSIAWRWGAWSWSQYLAKRGADQKVLFGARVAGALEVGRVTIAARVDGNMLPDAPPPPEDVAAAALAYQDPNAYTSLEAFGIVGVGLASTPLGLVSALCFGGVGIDVDAGRPLLWEKHPRTLGCGVRLDYSGGYVVAGAGIHDAAGAGGKGLLAVQVPIRGRFSVVADGALGGELSFVRYGIAYTIRSGKGTR